MDATDVEILRRLIWKPFDPVHRRRGPLRPSEIARDLDIHGSTVKRRMADLEDEGVLNGVHLMPEPGLIGLDAGLYVMEFPDAETKLEGVDHLIGRPMVAESLAFVGTEAWVGVMAPQDREIDAVARELGDAAGATSVELHHRRGWDVDLDGIADLDLQILSALRGDGLRPLNDVADEVGVTPRTVRHRFGRLVDARAFAIAANVSPARIRGLIPVVLDVRFEGPADDRNRRSVAKAFPDAVWRGLFTSQRAYPLLAVQDSAEVEDRLLTARRLPGVTEARSLLVQGSSGCAEGGHQPVFEVRETVRTT